MQPSDNATPFPAAGDTGCGTGNLVEKALPPFASTRFFLADPSAAMLDQARAKLAAADPGRLTFLGVACSRSRRTARLRPEAGSRYQPPLVGARGRDRQGVLESYQVRKGKPREEAEAHVERLDREFFPLTVTEHLELLRESGFRTAELFWYSYMQGGFFAIR